jgi:hypothetical protein
MKGNWLRLAGINEERYLNLDTVSHARFYTFQEMAAELIPAVDLIVDGQAITITGPAVEPIRRAMVAIFQSAG